MKILSNVPLPPINGFSSRCFTDYGPEIYRNRAPENDLRTMEEILKAIPWDEFPEILVLKSPEYLPIPPDIAVFPGIKILLITDWNMSLRFLPGLCKAFDICFTDLWGVEVLRKAGVNNIFHQPLFGHDPSVFFDQKVKKDIDISFCGNYNPHLQGYRNRLVAQLESLSDKYILKMGNFFNDQYVNILNRSRFVFNYSIRKEANMRLYETMACGSVALLEKQNREAKRLFQDGEHFLSYDPQRLPEEIERLMSLPREVTERIGSQAKQVVAKQTLSHQIEALLNRSRSIPKPSPSPEFLLPDVQTQKARTSLGLMRVCGLAFNTQTALGELETLGHQHKILEPLALPAMLIDFLHAIIQANGSKADIEILDQKTRLYLSDPHISHHLHHYFLAQLHLVQRRWEPVIHHADKAIEALENTQLYPILDMYLYGYLFLHSPVTYMDSLNTELNQSFLLDIENTHSKGPEHLIRLFFKQINLIKGQALLELGKGLEAEQLLQKSRSFSLPDIPPNLHLALSQVLNGHTESLKETLKDFNRLNPLGVELWEQVLNVYFLGELWDEMMEFMERCERVSKNLNFNDYWKNRVKTMNKNMRKKLQSSNSSLLSK